MIACDQAVEVALFLAAAAGVGLALVCLAIAASYKWRADAWEQAYFDAVTKADAEPRPRQLPAAVLSFERRAP